jgi:hypothetical protein
MPGKSEPEEKKSIEEYKKDYGNYISERLEVSIDEISKLKVVTEEE